MKIQLFLENEELELDKTLQFPLNKAFENLSNPTNIINEYSKTISIPFSKHNCEVLGNAYRLDRTIIELGPRNIGLHLDPSRKIPMKLMYNSQVVLDGYAKFDSSSISDKSNYFNINIFGILGEIFSELNRVVTDIKYADASKFKEDEDESQYVLDFPAPVKRLNRDYVMMNWQNDKPNTNDPYQVQTDATDIIGFAPTHRGKYPDFKSDTVIHTDPEHPEKGPQPTPISTVYLVGWRNQRYKYWLTQGFDSTGAWAKVDQEQASFKPEELFKEIEKDYQYNEYRTYMLKPYIYFNKLLYIYKHMCKKLTGYDINLDSSWFNDKNVYWTRLCYMFDFLKMTDPVSTLLFNGTKTPCRVLQTSFSPLEGFPGYYQRALFETEFASDEINLKALGTENTTISFRAAYHTTPNTAVDFKLADEVFGPKWIYPEPPIDPSDPEEPPYLVPAYFCGLMTYEYTIYDVYDGTDHEVETRLLWSTSTNNPEKQYALQGINSQIKKDNLIRNEWKTKISNDGYTDRNGVIYRTDTISVPIIPSNINKPFKGSPKVKLRVYMYTPNSLLYEQGGQGLYYVNNKFYNPAVNAIHDFSMSTEGTMMNINPKFNTVVNLAAVYQKEEPLFKVILDYTKMFGLVWDVDYPTKTITIKPRGKLFENYTVTSWDDKIDISKQFDIYPVAFPSDRIIFNYDDTEGFHYSQYHEKFDTNYGEKILNTQYKFKSEPIKLFDGIQTSCCSTRSTITLDGIINSVPGKFINKLSPQYNLIDCDSDDEESAAEMNNWFFRNSNYTFSEGIKYPPIVTDDNSLMQEFNTSCYMWKRTAADSTKFYIPQFNIATIDNDGVPYGCLFTCPKVDYTYDKLPTQAQGSYIYENFWSRFLNERYNIQNKKIECSVHMTPAEYFNFRFNKLVVIANQLFMINKIKDFDVNEINPSVKVELIQITDINSYINN